MTKDDAEKIVMMMEAAYPNYHPNKRYTVNAWGVLLKDYDYDVVEMALKSYIMSENKGFAPSIGQIVDIIHRIQRPDRLNCAQAWCQKQCRIVYIILWKNLRNCLKQCKMPLVLLENLGLGQLLKILTRM